MNYVMVIYLCLKKRKHQQQDFQIISSNSCDILLLFFAVLMRRVSFINTLLTLLSYFVLNRNLKNKVKVVFCDENTPDDSKIIELPIMTHHADILKTAIEKVGMDKENLMLITKCQITYRYIIWFS